MIHTKLEKIMFSIEVKDAYRAPSNEIVSVTDFIDMCMTYVIARQHDDINCGISGMLLDGVVSEFITLYSILYSNNLITEIQIFNIFNAKCYNKYTLKEVIY